MRPLKILSLFDGIGTARLALQQANIPIKKYYAAEINKNAKTIANKNFPDIIHLQNGDIYKEFTTPTQYKKEYKNINLLIAGFPCQSISKATNKENGLYNGKSKTFWKMIEIINTIKPKHIIIENVASMKTNTKRIISETLNIQPITLNSQRVCAQNRKRLYWIGQYNNKTNKYETIPIKPPANKNVFLKHILHDKSNKILQRKRGYNPGGIKTGKSPTITTSAWEHNNYVITKPITNTNITNLLTEQKIRKITPTEMEKLQTFPKNYTHGISNPQRYKLLGNAFTTKIIEHIIKEIFKNEKHKH